jgi:hypothetical protein
LVLFFPSRSASVSLLSASMLANGEMLYPFTQEFDDFMFCYSCLQDIVYEAVFASRSDGAAPAAGEAAGHDAAAVAPPGGSSEPVTVRCARACCAYA